MVIFTLYLPAYGSHGDAPFEHTLLEFSEALQDMQRQTPGSFVLGAADCNVQLKPMPGHVGSENGTSERPGDDERADLVMHAVAHLGLTVPSSYVDLGPTRTPWPGQCRTQQASVIDYLFASPNLICTVHEDDTPTPDTPTDHSPIGMKAQAPYASRRDRRQQFETQQAKGNFWGTRLPSQWAPSNLTGLKQRLKHTRFESLPQVAPTLLEAARETPSLENTRSLTKRKLLDRIRTATDPIIKRAYQIQLRVFRKEQRESRERNRILAWARGENWEFSRQIKIPAKLRYPSSLNDNPDRGTWGNLLGDYLRTLYQASPQESEDIHTALSQILRAANQVQHEETHLLPKRAP